MSKSHAVFRGQTHVTYILAESGHPHGPHPIKAHFSFARIDSSVNFSSQTSIRQQIAEQLIRDFCIWRGGRLDFDFARVFQCTSLAPNATAIRLRSSFCVRFTSVSEQSICQLWQADRACNGPLISERARHGDRQTLRCCRTRPGSGQGDGIAPSIPSHASTRLGIAQLPCLTFPTERKCARNHLFDGSTMPCVCVRARTCARVARVERCECKRSIENQTKP